MDKEKKMEKENEETTLKEIKKLKEELNSLAEELADSNLNYHSLHNLNIKLEKEK